MVRTAAKAKMAVKVAKVNMEKAVMEEREGTVFWAAARVVTEEMPSKENGKNVPVTR